MDGDKRRIDEEYENTDSLNTEQDERVSDNKIKVKTVNVRSI